MVHEFHVQLLPEQLRCLVSSGSRRFNAVYAKPVFGLDHSYLRYDVYRVLTPSSQYLLSLPGRLFHMF
jgi:hypothetical protein